MRRLAFIFAVALAASPATAQFDDPRPSTRRDAPAEPAAGSSEIRDKASMFSRDAVRESLARLVSIERTYRIPTTIETVDSLQGDTIDDAALRMAKRLGPQAKGVFVLIAKTDHKNEVLVSRDFAALLPKAKQVAIRDSMLADFRKGDFDAGLRKLTDTLESTLAASRGDDPKPTRPPVQASPTAPAAFTEPTGDLVKKNQVKLTLVGAKRLIAAAETKAAELGYKMNFAVVDDGGHLLAFERMDDARLASVATATTKAVSAATFRQATGPQPAGGATPDQLLTLSLQDAAAASGAKVTSLLGGVPILVEGQTIGAIGVAGGTSEQDAEIAHAAVAKFLADYTAATVTPK